MTCINAGVLGEHLPQFHLEKTTSADIEKTFDVMTDIMGMQKLLPHRFPSIRLLSSRGNTSVAEEHRIIAGRELIMTTRHMVDRPHKHEILVIGGDAKNSHIVELYESVGTGTRISLSVDFRLHGAMRIAGLFGPSGLERDFSKGMDDLVLAVKI